MSTESSTPWMFSLFSRWSRRILSCCCHACLFFLHLCLNVVFLQPSSDLSPALPGLWRCFLPSHWVRVPITCPRWVSLPAGLLVGCWFLCLYLGLIFLLWTWPSRGHLLLLEVDSGYFAWHFNCFSGLWSLGFTVLPCLFVCLVTALSAAFVFPVVLKEQLLWAQPQYHSKSRKHTDVTAAIKKYMWYRNVLNIS